jgi:uncharacterized protein
MSKAPPERIQPLRLAHRGETLLGSVGVEQMPRLAEMLHEAAGRVEFELRFGCDDGGQARVLGRIGARLVVLCQRCLEPMGIDVERQVRLALVRGDAEAAALDATYDPLLVGDQPVSLSGLLEDELILAMPNFCRHPRGECEMPRGADESRDAGGTSPGMDEVERSRMPEPRAMHGAIAEDARADTVEGSDESGQHHDAGTAGESGEDNPFSALEPLKSRKTP